MNARVSSAAVQNRTAQRLVKRTQTAAATRTPCKASRRLSPRSAAAPAAQLIRQFERHTVALSHVQFALDAAPLGIVCIDKNGSFAYANTAACDLFGWRHTEYRKRCIFDLVPNYSPPAWADYWNVMRTRKQALYQYPLLRQDRTQAVIEVHCVFFALHGREGVYAFIRDVTERERRERALRASRERLRHLTARVLHARDQERRRLARELHDDFGQSLALMKVRLSSMLHKISAGDSAADDCRETMYALERIIDDVRRLSRDLSPCMIEDLGLTASLRCLFGDFVRYNKLRARLAIADIDGLLGPDAQINLYRFCQETLSNIQKHAHARTISVLLQRRGRQITMRVSDNGVGFVMHPTGQEHRQRGLGLTTLEERACMLNGVCTIRSAPGRGTCVSLRFPAGGTR